MRVLLVDNYDSFTWNLVHYLITLGADVDVRRNDAVGADEARGYEAIVISPGPGSPGEAGVSLGIVATCVAARVPLLGVCLGHQAIGQHFGGTIVRAPTVMHGKTSNMSHDGTGLFAGLPSPFVATRYHSLIVAEMPSCLVATAHAPDGTIMALAHRKLPIHGVQFHPESVASEHGHALLANFLRLAGVAASSKGA